MLNNGLKGLSIEQIENLCYYDISSPSGLRWLSSNGRRRVKDNAAGSVNSNGYYSMCIKIEGRTYHLLNHRVIYCLLTKQDIPEGFQLDHIDRNRQNNNIDNLRLLVPKENCLNKSKGKNNTSGVTGVHWDNLGFWRVKWSEGGKTKRKSFVPSKLFPSLPEQEAKELAFSEAVKFRKNIERQFYLKGK